MFQPLVDTNNNGDDDNKENNNNNNNMDGGTSFGDDEFDTSANTSENPNTSETQEDGSDQDRRPSKRKRYHRHTQHQIQEMESFFKECPHPDDKQRKELSHQLGLYHLQIKFWFQNKRTQNKNNQERHENSQLRSENNRLRNENHQYREAIANALCPKCGGHTAIGEMSFEEHHLHLENAVLTEEIHHLFAVATKYTGKPSYTLMSHPIPARPFEPGMGTNGRDVYGSIENHLRSTIGVKDADKPLIIELAFGAMDELMAMAQVSEPLWKGGVINGTSLALNLDEYTRTFRKGLGPRLNGFRTEASRETAIVFMNHMSIVEKLMDVTLWSTMFAGIVARAMTHEALFTGVNGNFDGTFQLMTAEYQVLSPLVSTRESYFVRYCKQQGDGLWAVVDVSIDHLVPNLELKCRRLPSGCLIQHLPNGFSKVTWVEHVEVDDRGGVHNLYKHFINTGQALAANRWVTTLDRQCERLASIMATNIPSVEPDGLLTITNQAKQNILKLAERMGRSFFSGVVASTADMWCNLSGYAGDSVRLMTRTSLNDPGRPPGIILCAATSFWVPVPPNTVFDFLSDENNRINWDVLSSGGAVQKMSQIPNGRDSRNCVSLLQSPDTIQRKMVTIQESSTDPAASFVIYAPVDLSAIDIVFKGGDSDYVPLLPSGFAILPDGMAHPGKEGGSLISVAFQILVETVHSAKLTFSSVATIENLILATVQKIKAYFHHQTSLNHPHSVHH